MFKIDTELCNAHIQRSIRFPDKLFDKMDLYALQSNISFNRMVLECCKYAMDHLEDPPPEKQ